MYKGLRYNSGTENLQGGFLLEQLTFQHHGFMASYKQKYEKRRHKRLTESRNAATNRDRIKFYQINSAAKITAAKQCRMPPTTDPAVEATALTVNEKENHTSPGSPGAFPAIEFPRTHKKHHKRAAPKGGWRTLLPLWSPLVLPRASRAAGAVPRAVLKAAPGPRQMLATAQACTRLAERHLRDLSLAPSSLAFRVYISGFPKQFMVIIMAVQFRKM